MPAWMWFLAGCGAGSAVTLGSLLLGALIGRGAALADRREFPQRSPQPGDTPRHTDPP